MKKSLQEQSIELAISAPQVVTQRLTRLSMAGYSPSMEAYREVQQMWTEKLFGFSEACLVISTESIRMQQQLLASTIDYWSAPWFMPHALFRTVTANAPRAGENILRRAMAPIHGKVLENARRLNQQD